MCTCLGHTKFKEYLQPIFGFIVNNHDACEIFIVYGWNSNFKILHIHASNFSAASYPYPSLNHLAVSNLHVPSKNDPLPSTFAHAHEYLDTLPI